MSSRRRRRARIAPSSSTPMTTQLSSTPFIAPPLVTAPLSVAPSSLPYSPALVYATPLPISYAPIVQTPNVPVIAQQPTGRSRVRSRSRSSSPSRVSSPIQPTPLPAPLISGAPAIVSRRVRSRSPGGSVSSSPDGTEVRRIRSRSPGSVRSRSVSRSPGGTEVRRIRSRSPDGGYSGAAIANVPLSTSPSSPRSRSRSHSRSRSNSLTKSPTTLFSIAASSGVAPSGVVRVISSDGRVVDFPSNALTYSEELRNRYEMFGGMNIALPALPEREFPIDEVALKRIGQYLQIHINDVAKTDAQIAEEKINNSRTSPFIDSRDEQFLESLSKSQLIDTLLLSNFLGMPELVDTIAKVIAKDIKSSTPEQIRANYNN